MSKSKDKTKNSYKKLNIITMGGKGGVGKTTFMSALVEWFQQVNIPAGLLDFDTENQTKGGLQHFHKNAQKVNLRVRDGLDVFYDTLEREEAVVLADMGAGQGDAANHWFQEAYAQATELGAGFLMVGVVVNEPASVTSVLQWAHELGKKVKYLIVLNEMNEINSTFDTWYNSEDVKAFCDVCSPSIMRMKSRSPDLQNYLNDYGSSLRKVAEGQAEVLTFQRLRYSANANRIRTHMFEEFTRVIPPFLPDEN